MDLAWAKQLAEQTNSQEVARQERERKQKEDTKKKGLATVPFVEKLHVIFTSATEEYNKHVMFPELRIAASKLYKHSKTGEDPTAEPDEVAYFSIARRGMLYGVRGTNGGVEFVQMPISDTAAAFAIKLHEIGLPAVYKLDAELHYDTGKIIWVMHHQPLDGAAILSLCQKFFVDLIEQTTQKDK